MQCKLYSLIVYGAVDLQAAVGEYCEADGSGRCYRIYTNGLYYGRDFADLREASDYMEALAKEWHTGRIWRAGAKDVPYTGKKYRIKCIWQALTGGPLPGYRVNNNRR